MAGDDNWQAIITGYSGNPGSRTTITCDTTSDTQRAQDYEFTHEENHPKQVKLSIVNNTADATKNILSSTCALWAAGTGALSLGDNLELKVYPTKTESTLTSIFYGVITDINDSDDEDIIIVTAKDYVQKLEDMKERKIVFANYRDEEIYDTQVSEGTREITGVTDNNIVRPAVKISDAHTDTAKDYGYV